MSALIGERGRPYQKTPPDFHEDGLPYGAFCKCHRCGYIGRTTHSFDYRDDGGWLVCDACTGLSRYSVDLAMERAIASGTIDCDPLGPGCRGGYHEGLG